MASRYQHRPLVGERNQCPACGEYFETTAAFDAHRTGRYATLAHAVSVRYCLSVEAMRARGMRTTAAGYWVAAQEPPHETPHTTTHAPRGAARTVSLV